MINVYLIQLSTPQIQARPYDLEELEALALQVGLNPVQKITQNLSKPSAAYGIGKGKLEELKEMIVVDDVTMIVFFNELSNTQLRNLESALAIEVIDRTLLVLELLSSQAQTNLAKKLVAITQMRYLLPRLSALSEVSDRQQGGIGLKGPGETDLELNRRVLESAIRKHEKEIKKEQVVRLQNRKSRARHNVKTVALVGYTNAGKSTLVNRLLSHTHNEKIVLEKNQLFSTLDTQSRRLELDRTPPFIVTDTVGFISHMPKHLEQAFIATLEEIKVADLIVIVLDASTPYLDDHLEATETLLDQLSVKDIPTLYALNKIDLLPSPDDLVFYRHPYVKASFKTEQGFDLFLSAVKDSLFESFVLKTYFIPFDDDNTRFLIKEKALILNQEERPDGTVLTVKMDPIYLRTLKAFER